MCILSGQYVLTTACQADLDGGIELEAVTASVWLSSFSRVGNRDTGLATRGLPIEQVGPEVCACPHPIGRTCVVKQVRDSLEAKDSRARVDSRFKIRFGLSE